MRNLLSLHMTKQVTSSRWQANYWWRTCSLNLVRPTVNSRRPSVSSSLQITNRSFTYMYASPYLWNQLPSFRQPHSVHCPPGSPHPTYITSSQSSPSLPFTPDLKLISFTNPFLHSHSYSFRTDFTDLNLYWIKGALFVCCSFWLRVLD